MKLLVTGGAGYIGSHLVRELARSEQYKITIADDLSNGCYTDTLTDVIEKRQINFHKCDLFHGEHVKELFDRFRFDAVIHLAASVDVGESVEKPLLYYQNNVASTLNVLSAMHCYGIKKFIFASSAAVYTTECPYAHSKAFIEEVCRHITMDDPAFGAITLRLFNVAGGDCRSKSHLIPKLLRAIHNNEEFTIYGANHATSDGTCIRDYIHVDDVVRAFISALDRVRPGHRSYNIGTGKGYSVREVIDKAKLITGKNVKTIDGPSRPGDSPKTIANINGTQEELGWKPEKSIEEIIESSYANLTKKIINFIPRFSSRAII